MTIYNPEGGEFLVNTTTTNSQSSPSVTWLTGGGYVVTWNSYLQDGNDFGVFAQVFDQYGNKTGDEFLVNQTTLGIQSNPDVCPLDDGGFVIAWQDTSLANRAIFARIYSEMRDEVTDQIKINSTSTSASRTDPTITNLVGGGFVVSWQSFESSVNSWEIVARIYDSTGIANAPEFSVNSTTQDSQAGPSIASLANGGFVATWLSYGQDGDGPGIFAQIFDASGSLVRSEFQVNSTIVGSQLWPAVVGLPDGGFVITWESYPTNQTPADIYAQRFDLMGDPVGDEFLVTNTTDDYQAQPRITANSNGGFIISWTSYNQDIDGQGIFARSFDANGNPDGDEFLVNSTEDFDQSRVDLSANGAEIIVTWQSEADASGVTDIFAQVYSAAGNVAPLLAPNLQVVEIEIYVDASEIGLSATEAVTFRVEYNLDLVAGTGGFGTTSNAESYGGAALIISMGGEKVTLSGSILLFNDNFAGDQVDFRFQNPAGGPRPTFLGYQLDFARILLGDTSGSALDNLDLPLADGFVEAFNFQQTDFSFANPGGGPLIRLARTESYDPPPSEPTFQVTASTLPVIADQSFEEDTAVSFSIPEDAFSDPDGDALNYSATLSDGTALPSWLSFDPETRTFSGTPPTNFNGGFDVRVTASDGEFDASEQFTLTIDPVNDAPVLTGASGTVATLSFEVVVDSSGYGTIPPGEVLFGRIEIDIANSTVNWIEVSHPTMGVLRTEPAQIYILNNAFGGNTDAIAFAGPPSGELGGIIPSGGQLVLDLRGPNTILDSNAFPSDVSILNHFPQMTLALPSPANPSANTGVGTFSGFDLTGISISTMEDGAIISGQLAATDHDDGAVQTFTLNAPVAGLTVNPDGSWIFDPSESAFQHLTQGAFEQIVAAYTVTDEFGASDSATLTIGITGTNDAPVIDNAGDGTPEAVSGDTQVNTVWQGTQDAGRITSFEDGSFVAIWSDGLDQSDPNVHGQLFGPDGVRIGGEFLINDMVAGIQITPEISALENGGFVVTWMSWFQGTDPFFGVQARVFGSDGVPLGPGFAVNQYVTDSQSYPTVTALAGGGFVIAWESVGQDGSGSTAMARVFDADGTPTTDEFMVNQTAAGSQTEPTVAANADGSFTIAWTSNDGLGAGYAMARTFDVGGNALTDEFVLSTVNTGEHRRVDVESLSNGNLAVSWEAQGGIQIRLFEADGTLLTDVFQSNSLAFGPQWLSNVEALDNGEFIVSWASYLADGDGYAVVAQRFSAKGTKIGQQVVLDELSLGNQWDPSFEYFGDGKLVAIWHSSDADQDGDPAGIFMREFSLPATELVEVNEDDSIFVGQFQASDPDDGAALAFTLDEPVAGLTVSPDGNWSFDASDEAYQHLALGEVDQIIVNYTVTDEFGASDTAMLTIDVTGVNDAPVIDAPQGVIALGEEFVVNTQNIQSQRDPVVSELAGGGHVVVWTDWQTSTVKAQIYNADGNPTGAELVVNTSSAEGQPSVAGLADGTFVVAWQDYEASRSYDIKAQHFDATGAKLGNEFQVNSTSPFAQEFPFITALDDGGFVIGWRDASGTLGDNSDWSIKARVYDNSANPVDAEFLVNTTTAGWQTQGAASDLNDDQFVMVWVDYTNGIKGQVFDLAGTKLGAEFSIAGNGAARPSVTGLADGRIVVAWSDSFGGLGDNSAASVNFRIFDSSGNPLGAEVLVNDQTIGSQLEPVVTATSNGGFVISWIDTNVAAGDGSGTSIKAKAFDADSIALGEEFLVNSQTSGDQVDLALASVGSGFVVVWATSDATQDGDHYAVKAQQFDIATNPFVGIVVTEDVPSQEYYISAFDVDGDEVSYAIKSGSEPVLGHVQFDQVAGTFVYAPHADANGEDSFTIVVSDQHGGTVERDVSVTITPQNDAPVANPVEAALNEDGPPASINADYDDVDPGDMHTFAIDTSVTIGLVTNFGNGTFAYDPNGQFEWLAAGESTTDSFVYIVDDGMGGIDSDNVTITIYGQNDLPLVYAGEGQTTAITIYDTEAADPAKSVLTWFEYSDPDRSDSHAGSGSRISSSATVPLGTFGGSANSIPDGGAIGQALLAYNVSGAALDSLAYGETVNEIGRVYVLDDSSGQFSFATAGYIDLTVTLIGANDTPVAASTQIEAQEDDVLMQGQLLAFDIDNGAILTFSLDSPVAGLTVNPDGSWEFDPSDPAYQILSEGELLSIAANFTVMDEWGATDIGALSIELTGMNDAPVATDDLTSVDEDGMITDNVITGMTAPAEVADNTPDSDVDHLDTLFISEVNGQAIDGSINGEFGTLTMNEDGSYSYVADSDILDTMVPGTPDIFDVFSYTLSDDKGATSIATLTVSITILDDGVTIIGDSSPLIVGGDGDDLIDSGTGNDTVVGGGGTDMLFGDKGNDELQGGDGIDFLSGGGGNDALHGDAGSDVIFGGKGSDLMTGGEGADIFAFIDEGRSRADDTISDFEFGVDHIYLGEGLSVSRMREISGSTEVKLSDGQQILLEGVTGLSGMESEIFTPVLSGWAATLPIA